MSTDLSVARSGHGPPVVLLHGLGASGRYWERVVPLLHGARAVIAPDLLGFGRSPKPRDSPYDVDAHLAAIRGLVPAGATVVGHSVGAVLAAAVAVRHPEWVIKLVLVGLPAYPSDAVAREEVGRLGLLARLTVNDSPWARILCEMMCTLRPIAMAVGPLVVRDLPREIVRDGARDTWTSYSRTLRRVVVEHRVLPDLRALRAPTLLLHGRSDEEPRSVISKTRSKPRAATRPRPRSTSSTVTTISRFAGPGWLPQPSPIPTAEGTCSASQRAAALPPCSGTSPRCHRNCHPDRSRGRKDRRALVSRQSSTIVDSR